MALSKKILSFDINELIDYIANQSNPDDFLKARLAWLLKVGSQYVKDNKKLEKALKACGFETKTQAINALNTNAFRLTRSEYAPDASAPGDSAHLSDMQGQIIASGGKMNDQLKNEVISTLTPYIGAEAAEKAVSTAMDGTTGPIREAIRGIAAAGVEIFRPKPYTKTGDLAKEIMDRHQYGSVTYQHVRRLKRQQALVGAENLRRFFPQLTKTDAKNWQEILTSKSIQGILDMGKEKAVALLASQGGDATTAGLFFDKLKSEKDALLYGDFGDASSIYYDLADNTPSIYDKNIALGIATQLASQDVTAETGFMRAQDAVAAIRSYRDSGRDLFAGISMTYNHSELDRGKVRSRVRASVLQEVFRMDEDRAQRFRDTDPEKYEKFNTNFNRLYDKVAAIAFDDLSESETRKRYNQLIAESAPEDRTKIRKIIRHVNEEAAQQLVTNRIITEHKGLKRIQDELGKLEGSEKTFGSAIAPEHAVMAARLLGGFGTMTNNSENAYGRTARIVRAARRSDVNSDRLFSMASKAGENLREAGYDPSLAPIATELGMQALYSYKTSAGIRNYNAEEAQAAAMEVGAKMTTDVASRNLAWLLSIQTKPGAEGRELRALQSRAQRGELTADDYKILRSDMSQFADQVVGGRDYFESTRTSAAMNTFMKNMSDTKQQWFNASAAAMYFDEGVKEYLDRTDMFMSYLQDDSVLGEFGGRNNIQQTYQSLMKAGGFSADRIAEIISGTGGPLTPGELEHLRARLPESEVKRIQSLNLRAVEAAKANGYQAEKVNLAVKSGLAAQMEAVGETQDAFDLNQNVVVQSARKIEEERTDALLQDVVDTKKAAVTSVLDEGLTGGEALGTLIGRGLSDGGFGRQEIKDMAKKGVFESVLIAKAARAKDVGEFQQMLRLNSPQEVAEFLENTPYKTLDEMFQAVSTTGPNRMSQEQLEALGLTIHRNKYGQRLETAVLGSDEEYDENMKSPQEGSGPSESSEKIPEVEDTPATAAPADTSTPDETAVASAESHVYPTTQDGVLRVHLDNQIDVA